MAESASFISGTFGELRRRKIFRAVATYAVVAFIVLQLAEITFEPLHLPDWALTLVVILALLGFPVVLIVSWVFDFTPEGIQRTETAGSPALKMTALAFMLAIVGALGYFLFMVYQPSVEGGAESAQPATFAAVPPQPITAPPNSVAVLPFADLSQNQDKSYFSDGLTEELLNVLAQVDGLQVAARTSSFAFKGKNTDIKEIGRLLNVRTLLEGSVRQAGEQVRITAQLINVEDGFHIWSQTYDRRIDDIFAVQDEISREIVKAMLGSLDGEDVDQMASLINPGTENVEAYQHYRTGRLFWHERTPESLNKALAQFERAIELDPEYAEAWTGLADTYLLLVGYGNLSMQESVRKAEPAIIRALTLNGELAEAHASLGLMRWNLGQYHAAESALRRAISINPDYSMAHMWLGGLLGDQGRLLEEFVVQEQALKIDPLHPVVNANMAGNLMKRGFYNRAVARLTQFLDVDPSSDAVRRSLADFSAAYGQIDQSLEWAQAAVDHDPASPANWMTLGFSLVNSGNFSGAQQVLDKLRELAPNNPNVSMLQANLLLMQQDYEGLSQFTDELISQVEAAGVSGKESRGLYFFAGVSNLLTGDYENSLQKIEIALGKLDELDPTIMNIQGLSVLAGAYAGVGETENERKSLAFAQDLLGRAREQGLDMPELTYVEACLYAQQGLQQEALATLQAAYNDGFRGYFFMRQDRRLDSIADQEAFQNLLSRMKQDLDEMTGEPLQIALR